MTNDRGTPRRLPILVVLMLVACRSEEARVSVRYDDAPMLPREALTVTVDDGAVARTLRGTDIGGLEGPGRQFTTRRQGTLRVAFRMAPEQSVASEGAVEVALRSDWRYGFDIRVDSLDPTRFCFGCQGARAFPLAARYRRSARDSVWLVWGGNSITNPVVY